jgi:protein KRI1
MINILSFIYYNNYKSSILIFIYKTNELIIYLLNMSKSKSNEEDLNVLKINEDFAKKFQYNKKRQALEKAQMKYGKNLDFEEEDEESEDESEDSQGKLINDKVTQKFIDTYIKLKDDNKAKEFLNNKDSVFNDDDFDVKKEKKEALAYTAKDALLDFKDDDDVYSINYITKKKEKEDKEKKEFIAKANEDQDDEEDGDFLDDGLLKIKVKETDEYVDAVAEGREEENKDLEDYKFEDIVSKKKIPADVEMLKKFWGDEKVDKNEKFLRNYILSQAWLENNENVISKRLLIHDREDEEKDEIFDEYEAKYNFRFEEEGGANITTYKRDLETYREKDDSRKQKRKDKETRKEEEKKQIANELEMARQFKKEEVEKKLERIEKIAGTQKVKEISDQLEGDFDMEKFDKIMNKVFNEEYYTQKEEDNINEVIEEKAEDYVVYNEEDDEQNNEDNDGGI